MFGNDIATSLCLMLFVVLLICIDFRLHGACAPCIYSLDACFDLFAFCFFIPFSLSFFCVGAFPLLNTAIWDFRSGKERKSSGCRCVFSYSFQRIYVDWQPNRTQIEPGYLLCHSILCRFRNLFNAIHMIIRVVICVNIVLLCKRTEIKTLINRGIFCELSFWSIIPAHTFTELILNWLLKVMILFHIHCEKMGLNPLFLLRQQFKMHKL